MEQRPTYRAGFALDITLGRTELTTHSELSTNHPQEPHCANMKTFLLATARIATALFLAGLALSLTIALYSWGRDAYEHWEASPYESIKEWSSDLRSTLGIQLKAKTKVITGKLLLSVEGDGYPPYLSDRRLAKRNQKAHLTIHFLDSDGFRVFSKPIQIAEFTNIVGDKGENIGLRAEAQDHISLDDYKRFQRLQVEWTLVTEVPPESQEMKTDTGSLDHCAPNLTKAERLRRLSKHGELRETATGSYSAGERSVHFFYDGSLLNCH
jgi:hypothetical protein